MSVDDQMDRVRGWHVYGILMLLLAASYTIFPYAQSEEGTIYFIEQYLHLSRLIIAGIFVVSGVFVLLVKPKGTLYIVATSPLMFYTVATLFWLISEGTPLGLFFLHVALYLGLVRDSTTP